MAIEGWNHIINSPKWHFFEAHGRSLCGRWSTLEKDHLASGDDHPLNCAACKKKVAKHRESAGATKAARTAPAGEKDQYQ